MTDTAAPILDRRTPVVERIRASMPSLSQAERRVAETILLDPHEVIHLSVSELAAAAQTSSATVVRLCVSIGLRGYQDLKITLATQTMSTDKRVLEAVEPGDDALTITRKVLGSTAEALESASRALDPRQLEAIADAMLGSKRVLFGAVGTSAPLAQDAAYRLTTLGVASSFIPDVHAQHVSARMLTPDDLFFAVSHTGSTVETLAAARAAAASGARTVALTSFATSPLTEVVDIALVAGSAEIAYRVEAMSSRIVHFALLDALYVTLALRRGESGRSLALTEDILIEHRI